MEATINPGRANMDNVHNVQETVDLFVILVAKSATFQETAQIEAKKNNNVHFILFHH